MGTNFMLIKELKECKDDMDPYCHIGKRSAAGWYCWDCGVSLYKGDTLLPACPKCGNKPEKESIDNSAAGRELGFNKQPPKEKKGVKSAAVFSWAMKPESVLNMEVRKNAKPIIDEYGRKYTFNEFTEMLKECPLRRTGSIGTMFC